MEFGSVSSTHSAGRASVIERSASRALAESNHHLWRNRRFYWIAFVVIRERAQQERIRCSLGTANVVEARRRDALLRDWARREDCVLSLRIRGE